MLGDDDDDAAKDGGKVKTILGDDNGGVVGIKGIKKLVLSECSNFLPWAINAPFDVTL